MAGKAEITIESLLAEDSKEQLKKRVAPIIGEKSWYGDWKISKFTEAGRISRIYAFIDENNLIDESHQTIIKTISDIEKENISNTDKIRKIQRLLEVHTEVGKLYFYTQEIGELLTADGKTPPLIQTLLSFLSALAKTEEQEAITSQIGGVKDKVEMLKKSSTLVEEINYIQEYFGKPIGGLTSLKVALFEKIFSQDQDFELTFFQEKLELYKKLQNISVRYEKLRGSFGKESQKQIENFIANIGKNHTLITKEKIEILGTYIAQEEYKKYTVETAIYSNVTIGNERSYFTDILTYVGETTAQTQEPYKKFFSYFAVLLHKKNEGKTTQEIISENRSRNGNREETGGLNLTEKELYEIVDEVTEVLANDTDTQENFSEKIYVDVKGVGKIEISERIQQKIVVVSKTYRSLGAAIQLICHQDFPRASGLGTIDIGPIQNSLKISGIDEQKFQRVLDVVSSEKNLPLTQVLDKIVALIKKGFLQKEQVFSILQSYIVPGNKRSLEFLRNCVKKGIITRSLALSLLEPKSGFTSSVIGSSSLGNFIDTGEGVGIPENVERLITFQLGKQSLSKNEAKNVSIFMRLFLQIESSGGYNTLHYKRRSSAAGYFQYLTKNGKYEIGEDGSKNRRTSSYETALRCIPKEFLGQGQLLKDFTFMSNGSWKKPLTTPNVRSLKAEEQMILFISDMFKRSPSEIKDIIQNGNEASMIKVYEVIHNTAPDKSTQDLIKKSSEAILKPEKNQSGFSLIEVIIAAGIISLTVFGVYKLISENSKLIANKDIYAQKNILINDIKECIEVIGFPTFFGAAQNDYSFNFGVLNSSCITDVYNLNYSFPSVDISGIPYYLYGKIISKDATKIEWEIGVFEESTNILKLPYTQLP